MSQEIFKQAVIRGLQTAWLEYKNPSKPLLFLLHGYPDTPDTFSNQVADLKDKFHLILPYARGVGGSEAGVGSKRCRINAVTLDLLQIAELARPDNTAKIYVLGHDLGAVYGWAFSEALANRFGGLILIGGVGLPQAIRRLSSLRQMRKSWYMLVMQAPVFPEIILRRFAGAVLKRAYDLGQLPLPMRSVATGRGATLESIVVNPINHYRALLRDGLMTQNLRPKRLQGPLLVITGSRDAFVMAPRVEEFQPFVNDVDLRIMEGNHWIHREKSAMVNKAILSFLKGSGEHG